MNDGATYTEWQTVCRVVGCRVVGMSGYLTLNRICKVDFSKW